MRNKLIFCLLINNLIFGIKIDRVILSTNDNPDYLQFWPIVAQVWQDYIGIKPTLALIANEQVKVDETKGHVIRFEPIKNIPTSFQAQVIRLLLPSIFEDEVCLISDIDMIPLNVSYFTNDIKKIPNDSFVIFKNGYYERDKVHFKYPICYNASLGKNFQEIFQVKNKEQISLIIKKWYSYNLGWPTDELMLYKHLAVWPKFKSNCIKLNHMDDKRIDKLNWTYDIHLLKKFFYIDAHCPRPYENHKEQIDYVVTVAFRGRQCE